MAWEKLTTWLGRISQHARAETHNTPGEKLTTRQGELTTRPGRNSQETHNGPEDKLTTRPGINSQHGSGEAHNTAAEKLTTRARRNS